MERSTTRRARALLSAVLLLAPAAAPAAVASRWEVTVAVRISGGTGAPMALRLALPPSTPGQEIGDVEVLARGLDAEVVRDGPAPHVLLRGKLKGSRRVAVRYPVRRSRQLTAVPVIEPVAVPPPDLAPYLSPSPIFQSRSILVRDFLETNVTPRLGGDANRDLVRAILQATRDRLMLERTGQSRALDVIRSGKGNRIGIERTFTTFLRCARIPARLVEGINLNSKTRRKRVFWTEVWAQDRWWPISASQNWVGREPKHFVAVARDGQKVLTVDGPVQASYSVQAVALENDA